MSLVLRGKNNKKIGGTAATLKLIYSIKGGLDKYNDYVGEKYIKDFIKTRSKDINAEIEAEARRSDMRVMNL